MRSKLLLRNVRPVHTAAGALALAVPGSAVALAAGQPASPSTINVALNKRHVVFGGEVTVTGTAPTSDAGRILQLQFAQSGGSSWHVLRASAVPANGSFSVTVPLRRSGSLRVADANAASPRSSASASTTTATPASAQATSVAHPVSVAARFVVATKSITELGATAAHLRGRLLPAIAGRHVTLVGRVGGSWRTLASARTDADGRFDFRVRAGSAAQRSLRVRFAGDRVNTRSAAYAGRLTVLHESLASWYDDAGGTACGFHAQYGVANRTLPCGTRVTFYYGGRTVTAVVDDRGPFVGGRDWDLNQNTAGALGFTGVDTVWTSL